MSAARILPREEWDRLNRIHLPPTLPFVNPNNIAIAVVENQGDIVACLSALRVTHLEGLWISPWCRGNAGVARSLLRYAIAIPRAREERWAFGLVEDERMRGFLERIGGQRLPLDLYALGLGE